jgi:hypothetical protein
MEYRVLGNDGLVYNVPLEALSGALNYGVLYDSTSSFDVINPSTRESVRAPKKELQSFLDQGYQLDFSNRRPVRMVDSETLEVFEIPYERVGEALQMGGLPARGGREPEFDATGEGFGLSGKRDWTDALRQFKESPSSFVPFLNAIDIFDSVKLYRAAQAVRNNRATPEQRNLITRYTAQQQQDTTWGFKVADIAMRIPAYAVEFMTGGLLLKGLAKGAITQGSKAAVKQGAEAAAQVSLRGLSSGVDEVLETAARTKTAASVDDLVKAQLAQFPNANEAAVRKQVTGRLVEDGLLDASAMSPVARSLAWLADPAPQAAVRRVGDKMLRAGATPPVGPTMSAGRVASLYGGEAVRAAAPFLGQAAGAGVARTALVSPHRVVDQTLVNMTPVFGLTADQRGNAELFLADEGDDFGKAFLRAFGDMAIENFSESVGSAFLLLRATAGKAAKDYLKSAVTASSMDKIARRIVQKTGATDSESLRNARKAAADFVLGTTDNPGMIQKLGWDGYFSELGEEAVGEALRQAFGIAPVGLPSLEEVSAMAVGFLLNPLALGFSAHNTAMQRAAKARIDGVELRKKMVEQAGELGIVSAENNEFAQKVTELVERLAEEPSGIFGKLMHKVWTAPVARMEAEALYQAIAPTEEGVSFAEEAGAELFNPQARVYAPSEQMFLGYVQNLASHLGMMEGGARGNVNRDQIDGLLRFMGVFSSRADQQAAVEKLQQLKADGAVISVAPTPGNPSGLRAYDKRILLRLKPGQVLSSAEMAELREAFPYLHQNVSISEWESAGRTKEELQALSSNPDLLASFSPGQVSSVDTLLNILAPQDITGKGQTERARKNKQFLDVASVFGWTGDIMSEVGLDASVETQVAAIRRRLEPFVATLRTAAQYGLSVDLGFNMMVTGTGKQLTEYFKGDVKAYGRELDPDKEYSLSTFGKYRSGSERVFVSAADLVTREGVPALVEEVLHALSLSSRGKLLDSEGGMSDLVKSKKAAIKELLENRELNPNTKKSLRTVARLLNNSPEEFLVKYFKASVDLISEATPEEVALRKVYPLIPATDFDFVSVARDLVQMDRVGSSTEGRTDLQKLEDAEKNFKNLLLQASKGLTGATADTLGKPPPRDGLMPETPSQAEVVEPKKRPAKPGEKKPEAKKPGGKKPEEKKPTTTPREKPSAFSFEAVSAEVSKIEAGLDQLPEDATGVGQINAALSRLKPLLEKAGPELDEKTALKLANEITRLRRNTGRMDKNLEGVAQVDEAANRIKNQLEAAGYEFENLIGKPYLEGLNAIADFKYDESLPPGTATITNVLKPQINRGGKMIQAAEIVVTKGPSKPESAIDLDDVTFSSSSIADATVPAEEIKRVRSFLRQTESKGISLSRLSSAQILQFANRIKATPTLIGDTPDKAEQDRLLRRMREAIAQNNFREAQDAGFDPAESDVAAMAEMVEMSEMDQETAGRETDLTTSYNEDALIQSELARIVSIFPEGREREREIVGFFGYNPKFRQALRTLITEEQWAEFFTDSKNFKPDPFTDSLREQTARMLLEGRLSVDELYALAALRSVRYVPGEVVEVRATGSTFEPVRDGSVAKVRRNAVRTLGRLDDAGMDRMEGELRSLLELYEAEKKRDAEIRKAEKEERKAGKKKGPPTPSLFLKVSTSEVEEQRRRARRSLFEVRFESFMSNYLGIDPLISRAGLYYSTRLSPENALSNRFRNINEMLQGLLAAVEKKPDVVDPAARRAERALEALTSRREGNKPAYIYQIVSPANRQDFLFETRQEFRDFEQKILTPERYRDTVGKMVNAATAQSAVLRALEKARVQYSFVAGALGRHSIATTFGTREETFGFDKKQVTGQDLYDASYSSWKAAAGTGDAYRLDLGVFGSKDRYILVKTPAPTGVTYDDWVRSVLTSRSAEYVNREAKKLIELGVDPNLFFPSLRELRGLIGAKTKSTRKLFEIQSALDRAYYRGLVISPSLLVRDALRKMGKEKATTPEDQRAIKLEWITEAKRSSSMVTPQRSFVEDVPNGFGRTMKVLVLADPEYRSLMFPGDKGDRTDGLALLTRKGVVKAQASGGGMVTRSVMKGLHAGQNLLFKESQSSLPNLALRHRQELGDRADQHPWVQLENLIDAMPLDQQPDLIRFVSTAKVGGKEKAARDIWDYTPDGSPTLKPDFTVDPAQVFEVPTADFGLVGKSDKDPVPVPDKIPTQWLPSNLGTSPLMSSEFEAFVGAMMERNFAPERVDAMIEEMQTRDPAELLRLVRQAKGETEILQKLEAGEPLSVLERRRLSLTLASRISSQLGQLRVNRSSLVAQPSLSFELEGTRPEEGRRIGPDGFFVPASAEDSGAVFRMSRVRANVRGARYEKAYAGNFNNEMEAYKAATQRIFGNPSLYRDLISTYRKNMDTPAPENSADAARQFASALLRVAEHQENVSRRLLDSVRARLEEGKAPSADSMVKLIAAVPAADVFELALPYAELHELDVGIGAEGKFEYTLPGSFLMFIRVPSAGPATLGVARLSGKVGDGNTNQIIMHPDDSARAGADFDIDSWYTFGPEIQRGRAGKIGIGSDLTASWLVRLAQGMVRDVEGHRERYSKTDPEAYNTLARARTRRLVESMDVPYYSSEAQNRIREANLAAKQVVGILASNVRVINALRVRGLNLRKFGSIRDPRQLDRFTVTLPTENENFEFVFGNVREISRAAVSHFNTMLQMAVDNDKLFYLPGLGINNDNASLITAFFLFNPDLMRGDANQQEFESYLDKVLRFLQDSPEAQEYFRVKARNREVGAFAENGFIREVISEETSSSPVFQDLMRINHLADTLYALAQTQNITNRGPVSFENQLERQRTIRELVSPTGYNRQVDEGVVDVSVDTRQTLVTGTKEGRREEDRLVFTPIFGNPVEMNRIYREAVFQSDPTASRSAYKLTEVARSIAKRENKNNVRTKRLLSALMLDVFAAEAAGPARVLVGNTEADTEQRGLNTRLIERTKQLQEQNPNNEFLLAINAEGQRRLGPEILEVLAKNEAPESDSWAPMKEAAKELPMDYLQDLFAYSRLRWGNNVRSYNGNLISILPAEAGREFAARSEAVLQTWRNGDNEFTQYLIDKYYRWIEQGVTSGESAPFLIEGPRAIQGGYFRYPAAAVAAPVAAAAQAPAEQPSLAQEWTATELWPVERLVQGLRNRGGEAAWIQYELAPEGSTPVMEGTMYFPYGPNDPGAQYGTTFRAIQEGARTSTTRYKDWPQYERYSALKPGDVVRFWSTKERGKGESVDVVVKSVRKITEADLAPTAPATAVGPWTRASVARDAQSLYLFTDNTDRTSGAKPIPAESWYSKRYGAGKKFPTMTQAVIRGLDNARPISTMKNIGSMADARAGRNQWKDSDFELFKTTIDAEIQDIKDALPQFPGGLKYSSGAQEKDQKIGQGAISKLPPRLQEYLDQKLLEVGIDQRSPAATPQAPIAEAPAAPAPGENIASKSRGGSELGSALTNVTFDKWKIDRPALVDQLTAAGLKKPTDGMSAEHWYKANQAPKTDPQQDAKDMATMQKIIEAKLTQYPNLVDAITRKGGSAWLMQSEHRVFSKPRTRPSGFSWEGKGEQSGFLRVLDAAYRAKAAPAPAAPAAPAQRFATGAPAIQFLTSASAGYPTRTFENAAAADVTIDFAFRPTGSGGARGLTKVAANRAKKLYIHVPITPDGFNPLEASRIIRDALQKASRTDEKFGRSFSVNLAGHELGKMNIPQERIDQLVAQTLRSVQTVASVSDGGRIASVRSGGQTGFDEAGIKAGVNLGLPTTVLAPRNWNYRPTQRDVINDEAGFKARFPTPTQEAEGPQDFSSATVEAVDAEGNINLRFSWSDDPRVLQKLRGWARSAPAVGERPRGGPARVRPITENDVRNSFISTMQGGDIGIQEAQSVYDLLKSVGWERGEDIVAAVRQIEETVMGGLKISARTRVRPEEQEIPDYYTVNALTPEDMLELQDITEGRPPEFPTREAAESWVAQNGLTGAVEVTEGFDMEVGVPPTESNYESLSVNKGQGEYKEYFIKGPFEVPGQHGSFQDPNLFGWFRVREYADTGTVEVQEVQSELFQQNKGGFGAGSESLYSVEIEGYMYRGLTLEEVESLREEASPEMRELIQVTGGGAEGFNPQQAALLNLMLNNQTWVPVFVNAITQWAKQQGFEKVRFPTGTTAAKVEGLPVFEDRLKELQKERSQAAKELAEMPEKAPPTFTVMGEFVEETYEKSGGEWLRKWPQYYNQRTNSNVFGGSGPVTQRQAQTVWENQVRTPARDDLRRIDAEINEIKSQGIEKIAPIEAFYENRVGSIANRLGATPVTDANGNTWREVPAAPQDFSSSRIAPLVASAVIAATPALAQEVQEAGERAAQVEAPQHQRTAPLPQDIAEVFDVLRAAEDFTPRAKAVATNEQGVVEYNIGYGWNLSSRTGASDRRTLKRITGFTYEQIMDGQAITEQMAQRLMQEAWREKIIQARREVDQFGALPVFVRQAVVDSYYMNAFPSFPTATAALKRGDFVTAGRELLDNRVTRRWTDPETPNLWNDEKRTKASQATLRDAPTVHRFYRNARILERYGLRQEANDFRPANVAPMLPRLENWPGTNATSRVLQERTDELVDWVSDNPAEKLLVQAVLAERPASRQFLTSKEAQRLKDLVPLITGAETQENVIYELMEAGIPEGRARHIATETRLPTSGVMPPPTVDMYPTNSVLDGRIEYQNRPESVSDSNDTAAWRYSEEMYYTDAEAEKRWNEEQRVVSSSFIAVMDMTDPLLRRFESQQPYDAAKAVLDRVRAMDEQTAEWVHSYKTLLGVTGTRIIQSQELVQLGANPETGEIVEISRVEGVKKSFWGRLKRGNLVQGPDGEVTAADKTAQKKNEWVQGAVLDYRVAEGSLRFNVADALVATHEARTGKPSPVKTTGRHINIRSWLIARGRKEGGKNLSQKEALAAGFNSLIEEALDKADVLVGGAPKVIDKETEKYKLDGQTRKARRLYNEWLNSKMFEKLKKAGRSDRVLRIDSMGANGFYEMPFAEQTIMKFYEEYLRLNELYEQATGEKLMFSRSGYFPHIAGGGFFTAEEEEWLRRRQDHIRDRAKNALPFIEQHFSDRRYEKIPSNPKEAAPTRVQREWYRRIQEYVVQELEQLLERVERENAAGQISRETEKEVRERLGMRTGLISPRRLIGSLRRRIRRAEEQLTLPKNVENFLDADAAIHRALMTKLHSEIQDYRRTGKFEAKLSREEEGLYNRLSENMGHPNFSESSKFLRTRSYDTWRERFEETGDLPNTLSPYDSLSKYASNMHALTRNRSILGYMATNVDFDGRPSTFISFTQNFDPDAKDSPLPRGALTRMVINMGEYLYRTENGTTEFLYDPNKPIQQQIRKIADYLNRHADSKVQDGAAGYVPLGKGMFKYIDQIYGDRGDAAQMLKKIASQPWSKEYVFRDRKRDLAKLWMDLTVLQKIARVSFSAFFPLAAVESSVGYYAQFKEAFLNPKGMFGRGFLRDGTYYMGLNKLKEAMLTGYDPAFNEFLYEATRNGLMVNVLRDYDMPVQQIEDILQKLGDRGKAAGYLGKPLLKGAESLVKLQTNYSKWLFGSMFPLLKVHSSYLLYQRAEQSYRDLYGHTWSSSERADTLQWIARTMNNGFGGQNWDQYTWATPRMMQALNLAFFAPNWSLSSINTQGFGYVLNKMGLGPKVGPQELEQMVVWNALVMGLALTAWPNVLQAIIYAVTRPFGDDEDERVKGMDVPFTWQNEMHRKYHVDVTPLIRNFPWYKGDPTGDRRFFVRWGKQMYEVTDGWLMDPVSTLLRKTSMPVQMVMGNITGTSTGSDYPLPFKDAGAQGLIWTQRGGFWGSRVAFTASHFVPFSLPSLINMSDAAPLSLISQVSKGMTTGTASRQLSKIYSTYAWPDSWGAISKNPQARENLRALSMAMIEAIERNGYPTDKMVNDAKGAVLRSLYLKLFDELEKKPDNPNTREIEKWANAILRVNGTFRGFQDHMKSKERSFGLTVTLTPAQEEAIRNAFARP